MGETTRIAWCDHTFNAWRGCTKAGPECSSCYAETLSARNPSVLGSWGPRGTRVPAAESYWRLLRRWDWAACAAGERRRVFVNSLSDIFEGDETMPAASRSIVAACRERLWREIEACQALDFLLLTKRPENAPRLVPASWSERWPENVWAGTSAGNQEWLERRLHGLAMISAPVQVRFLSLEPLLGPVNIVRAWGDSWRHDGATAWPIDWIIVGGESGRNHRACEVSWIADIARQCADLRIACFVKQDSGHRPGMQGRIPDELWALKQWPEVVG